jgi:hypothetical protein
MTIQEEMDMLDAAVERLTPAEVTQLLHAYVELHPPEKVYSNWNEILGQDKVMRSFRVCVDMNTKIATIECRDSEYEEFNDFRLRINEIDQNMEGTGDIYQGDQGWNAGGKEFLQDRLFRFKIAHRRSIWRNSPQDPHRGVIAFYNGNTLRSMAIAGIMQPANI